MEKGNMDLDTLYKGKPTIVGDREYNDTKYYVAPFIDMMSKYTDKFIIKAERPNQMTRDEKDNIDVTYNRVWVQAVMPEDHCVVDHDEVVSMLYGIDGNRPVVKFYRGLVNRACTNLCVFQPQWLNVQKFMGGKDIDYSIVKPILESTDMTSKQIPLMKNQFIAKDEVADKMGEWIDSSFRLTYNGQKLSQTVILNGYKSMFINQKSRYFIPENREVSMFEIYNALTQQLTDQDDFRNRFEQTMLVGSVLNV